MSFFNLFGKSGDPPEETNQKGAMMEALKGRLARATTPLRSIGLISVDGKTYEAMSTQGFISEGSLVKITGYTFGNLTVEAAE